MSDNNEWQVDERGQRYRNVGIGCREYEMEYSFICPDQDQEEREAKEDFEKEKKLHTGRECPIKNGINTECSKDCAFYGNKACFFSMKEPLFDRDTSGKKCPIFYSRECNDRCAFYFRGCGIVKIVKAGREGTICRK